MKSEANKKKAKYYRMTEPAKQEWAKAIAEFLQNHYPGHGWYCAVEGGVAKIQALSCSGRKGFMLRLFDIDTPDTFRRELIHAGGEMLERFYQPRGRADKDLLRSARRNVRGDIIADDADRVRRKPEVRIIPASKYAKIGLDRCGNIVKEDSNAQ